MMLDTSCSPIVVIVELKSRESLRLKSESISNLHNSYVGLL